ncbi:MAG: type IV pilus twitching motility protein PilT [Actinomycetota bacterium]
MNQVKTVAPAADVDDMTLATSSTKAPTSGRRTTDPTLDKLLRRAVELGASDLHITVGTQPIVRVNGDLVRLEGYSPLQAFEVQDMLVSIMSPKEKAHFEEHLAVDLAHSISGVARFRVNCFKRLFGWGAAFRYIPEKIRPLAELGVPHQVGELGSLPRGLILVTGPTGSGKSSTLAAVVDLINRNRPCHILTIEDPIEYLHEHRTAMVNQREIGEDATTFGEALRSALRQDPDVILVGEMRDLETIATALTAAETGHLVLATLHTRSAPESVERIVDVFPPHQQTQVRAQLAGSIQAIITQQLLRKADDSGRTVACEIMLANSAVRNLIREGKTHMIPSTMQAGAAQGMQTMDQALAGLVKRGVVTYQHAFEKCNNAIEFQRLAGKG